jgi:tight adherence protein B
LAAFLLVWTFSGLVVVALPAAVVALFLPKIWFMRRRAQRMLDLQAAWPDGLRDVVASISSGMSLGRALEQLAITGPTALRQAFSRFSSLSRAIGVVPALESIKSEMAHPTSDRIIEVMIVAHERGGPIVLSILRDLTEATTKDTWAGEEIATLALEQKINARVVFVIPWVMLAFITTRPGPFRDFYASSAGVLVVAIGGSASIFGMWLASRLGSEPDEPRVFGKLTS